MSELNNRGNSSRYSPLAAEKRNNNVTRELWSSYASHRRVMTGLVRSAAEVEDRPKLPTLCVLGAGNINDLRLAELLPRFSEIRLVDFDRHAVEGGIARQAKEIVNPELTALFQKRVSFVGPFDLSGVTDLLAIAHERRIQQDEQVPTGLEALLIRGAKEISRYKTTVTKSVVQP